MWSCKYPVHFPGYPHSWLVSAHIKGHCLHYTASQPPMSSTVFLKSLILGSDSVSQAQMEVYLALSHVRYMHRAMAQLLWDTPVFGDGIDCSPSQLQLGGWVGGWLGGQLHCKRESCETSPGALIIFLSAHCFLSPRSQSIFGLGCWFSQINWRSSRVKNTWW